MKNSNCKKIISLALLFVLLSTLIFAQTKDSNAQSADFDPYSAFRLHIIANSDSNRDQNIKLAVRDAILDYERTLFETLPNPPETAEETRKLLMENGSEVLGVVKSTLKKYGADYSATLHVGEYAFPDRTYGDILYPAGDYQAFRIVLGNGGGKNWWCVMFPPLCILEGVSGQSDSNAENNSTVELKSIFSDLFGWVSKIFSK